MLGRWGSLSSLPAPMLVKERAESLARLAPGTVEVASEWRAVVERPDVDVVVVATTHDGLAEITLAAVAAGKHVLVEKPAARNARASCAPVIDGRGARGVVVKVGLQPPLSSGFPPRRSELFDDGAIGPLMYIRGRYGHGGRLGYDREWRADPAIAGGGELLDQGVHLIDLARWFLGDFAEVAGPRRHVLLGHAGRGQRLPAAADRRAARSPGCTPAAPSGRTCSRFEIFGRDGKLQIDGLGGSYGVERLTFYRMLPQMGPPETTIWEYPGEDRSWRAEFAAFRRVHPPSGASRAAACDDALAALRGRRTSLRRLTSPDRRRRAA